MTLIFHPTPGLQLGRVQVPEPVVWVSAVTAPATTPGGWPTYANWVASSRLKVTNIFRGSSIAGPSYADVELVGGAALYLDTQVDAHNAGTVLKTGDRLAVGYKVPGGAGEIYWLFAGYVAALRATISNREQVVWRVNGPEWAWGTGDGREGAGAVVHGQFRRNAASDAAFAADETAITAAADGRVFTDLHCVFNPAGRKNMSRTDVALGDDKPELPEDGAWDFRPFEEPERKIRGVAYAGHWTMRKAVQYLLTVYGALPSSVLGAESNDPARTGIAVPELNEIGSTVPVDTPVRDVDVDGQPLWEALKRVLEPEFAFYVTCQPSGLTLGNNKFEGFRLVLARRSAGAPATLYIDPRGTEWEGAGHASITRLDVKRDVAKVVNRVKVLTKRVRFLRLVYWGWQTATRAGNQARTMLQHGWTDNELLYASYAASAPGAVVPEITDTTLDSTGKLAEWQDRYVTSGREFQKHQHVLRHFVWNEAGEFYTPAGGDAPQYPQDYADAWSFPYVAPDLTGVADSPDHSGEYCRRRRPALETLYQTTTADEYNRQRPALYMTATEKATTTELPASGWVRVTDGHWRLDPDRCGFYVTASDLATWKPFEDVKDAPAHVRGSGETFASLLYSGRLRFVFECCVETDWGDAQDVTHDGSGGNPMQRSAVVRGERDFLVADEYAGNVATNPSGQTPVSVDHGADAFLMGATLRQAGKDAQTHASMLVAADWPEQPMFGLVTTILGRNIDLTANGGQGAQIVAMNMDFTAFKWELLTESAALEIRGIHNEQYTRRRRGKQRYRTMLAD